VPKAPLLRLDMTDCPLPSESIDVVVLLNVLEHIERDDLALRHAFRILKPGGLMVVEVPFGPSLYDAYDELLMHHRRYDMPALEGLTSAAGFATIEKSHLGFFLYPAFWTVKRLQAWRARPASLEFAATVQRSINATRRVNRVAAVVMGVENWLRRQIYLPIGIRCLINCRKPVRA